MTRRSDTITPVALELREDAFAAEWPRLWFQTGDDSSLWSAWRHPRRWRLFVAIHFRLPEWRIERRLEAGPELVVTGRWYAAAYVEPREHAVLAQGRERALACLVGDLRRDPRAEFITRAVLYHVAAPLTAEEMGLIDACNGRLAREREQAQNRPAPVGRQLSWM